MKIIVILVTYILSLATFADDYLCQNINFQFIDGSRNAQPMYIKLDFEADSDLEMKLFERNTNPLSENSQSITRVCDETFNHSFEKKSLICNGLDVFGSQEAVAYVDFKIDRFTSSPRETFLLNFYETQTHSNRYQAYPIKDSLRQFYCQKTE